MVRSVETRMPVRYSDGTTDVLFGDRAEFHGWFKRRSGRVVYVPGISAMNAEFEYNGMRWVGIRLDDGSLLATPVLLPNERLKTRVRFVGRDTSPCELITASSREFEDHGEGLAL